MLPFVLVSALAALAADPGPSAAAREPVFAGKTQEEWLAFYESGQSDPLMRLSDVVEFFEPPAEKVVPRLVKILRTGIQPQRLAAAEALELLGPRAKEARDELWQFFAESEGPALEPAGRALAALGPELAPLTGKLIPLLPAAPAPADQRAKYAALALKSAGKPAAAALAQELAQPDRARALRVLPVLATLGPDAAEAVPAIARALESPELAAEAASALIAIGPGGKAALPTVLRLLESKDLAWQATPWSPPPAKAAAWGVRESRVRLLQVVAAIGADASCYSVLESLLASDDETLRLAAATALKSLASVDVRGAKIVIEELSRVSGERPLQRQTAFEREQSQLLRFTLHRFDESAKAWLKDHLPQLPPSLARDVSMAVGFIETPRFTSLDSLRLRVRQRLHALGIDPESYAISDEGRRKIDELLARGQEDATEEDWSALAVAARKDEALRRRIEPILIERYLQRALGRGAEAENAAESAKLSLNLLGELHPESLGDWLDRWNAGEAGAGHALYRVGPRGSKALARLSQVNNREVRQRSGHLLVYSGLQAAGTTKEILACSHFLGDPLGRREGYTTQIQIVLRALGPLATSSIAAEYATADAPRREFLVNCLDAEYLVPFDEHAQAVFRSALADDVRAVRLAALERLGGWPEHVPDDRFGIDELRTLLEPKYDVSTRVGAAYVLARRGVQDPQLVPALLSGLDGGLSKSFAGLVRLGPVARAALPALRERLARRSSFLIEQDDMQVFRSFGPLAAEAAPELTRFMERREPYVSCDAARVLWEACGDDRAILYLCDVIRQPRPANASSAWGDRVRYACKLLGEIGPRAKLALRWIPADHLWERWQITRSPELARAILAQTWMPRSTGREPGWSGSHRDAADRLLEVMPQVADLFAQLPEPPDDDRRLILARIAWKQGRREEALAHWRKYLRDLSLDSRSSHVHLYRDLYEFGAAAKALAPDIIEAMEYNLRDRNNILARSLVAIDREAYFALLRKWAAVPEK